MKITLDICILAVPDRITGKGYNFAASVHTKGTDWQTYAMPKGWVAVTLIPVEFEINPKDLRKKLLAAGHVLHSKQVEELNAAHSKLETALNNQEEDLKDV